VVFFRQPESTSRAGESTSRAETPVKYNQKQNNQHTVGATPCGRPPNGFCKSFKMFWLMLKLRFRQPENKKIVSLRDLNKVQVVAIQ
ncbi:MAG: hypothetical protein J6U05_07880, partial [Neisseriaceae bacterium]|nr:hypothetical protein [Neisseriaceae bacterium]